MASLRLLPAAPAPAHLGGTVGACAFTPDSAFVLSGGFEGRLHLWEASRGTHITEFQVSQKPVSACTVSPDGQHLVSGSLDGMIALWDAVSHEQKLVFMGSPRPIAALVFSSDGRYLASASWDGNVNVWHNLKERQGWTLSGHRDIVAGCCFTPDARQFLSWSHDSTVRLWDLPYTDAAREFLGHSDRVTAGTLAPDGRHAVTGSRDGSLCAWDLRTGNQTALAALPAEVRGCKFLGDGSLLLAVDLHGRLTLHQFPGLHEQHQLATRLAVECCDLSPNSRLVALGCGDGKVRLVSVDGMDSMPLLVQATQITRQTATTLQRLFGNSTQSHRFQCTCPNCREVFELASGAAGLAATCPHCKQKVKSAGVVRVVRE